MTGTHDADVIVVGAGLAGLVAAAGLADLWRRVTIGHPWCVVALAGP